MPIFLLIVGAVLLATAVNNTTGGLFSLLGKEFSGADQKASFIPWFVSILAVGAIGYIPGMKWLANGLLVLVFLVLILTNQSGSKGLFSEFRTQVQQAQRGQGVNTTLTNFLKTANTPPAPATPAPKSGGLFGLIGGGGLIGSLLGINSTIDGVLSGAGIGSIQDFLGDAQYVHDAGAGIINGLQTGNLGDALANGIDPRLIGLY